MKKHFKITCKAYVSFGRTTFASITIAKPMSLLVEQLLPQLPFSNTGTCFSVGGKCGIENQYKFLP